MPGAAREHRAEIAHHPNTIFSHELGVTAAIAWVFHLRSMFHDRQKLLIFEEFLKVLGLNRLMAVIIWALLGVSGQDVSDTELAECVATVRHNHGLPLIKCVVVLTPFTLQVILHIIYLIIN
jgi:hypothetical protein